MNKLHLQLQKEYSEEIESISSYKVSFSSSNLYVSLLNKEDEVDEIISRAHVVGDSLQLEPMEIHRMLEKRDFLFVMKYWTAYANMENLTTICLIPKTNQDERTLTWDDLNYSRIADYLTKLSLLSSDDMLPSTSLEKFPDMLELLVAVEESMHIIKERDITFYWTPYGRRNPNSFISYFFSWKGTENDFHLTIRNDDYYLEWNNQSFSLTLDNTLALLTNILEEITDNVRLKNLVNPPVVHLAAFMESIIGTTRYDSEVRTKKLAKSIMDDLIHLGCSNDEIEAEACRMYTESSVGIHLPHSKLPYREQTIFFLNKYYVSVIIEKDHQYTYNITEKKEDVFSFYMKHQEKHLALYLSGFQKQTI